MRIVFRWLDYRSDLSSFRDPLQNVALGGLVLLIQTSCQSPILAGHDTYGYIRHGMLRKDVLNVLHHRIDFTATRDGGWENKKGYAIDRIGWFQRHYGVPVWRYDLVQTDIVRHEHKQYPYRTQFITYELFYDDFDKVAGIFPQLVTRGFSEGNICTIELPDKSIRMARIVYLEKEVTIFKVLNTRYETRPDTVDKEWFWNHKNPEQWSFIICRGNIVTEYKPDGLTYLPLNDEEKKEVEALLSLERGRQERAATSSRVDSK